MVTTNAGPRLTYFRHGELSLLLEPKEGHTGGCGIGRRALNGRDLSALRREVLDPVEVQLHDDPIDGPAGARLHLPMRRARRGSGEQVCCLETVHLASWIAQPERESDLGRLSRSIGGVSDAVTRINARVAEAARTGRRIEVDDHLLVAASPNWLAAPLEGG